MGKEPRLPTHVNAETKAVFPNLTDAGHAVTSPKDGRYNCIAHAAGETDKWWEPVSFPDPGYYWPPDANAGYQEDDLRSCFESLGYEVCSDGKLEEGHEKVVLYGDGASWTHAARQRADGNWSSKLGVSWDMTHATPECLSSPGYGAPRCFLKRAKGGPSPM